MVAQVPAIPRLDPVVEVQDLHVTVVEFDKQQPAKNEGFAMYKIRTESSRREFFPRVDYEVWRRYRDFEWLREQLVLSHPTHIIPPLPGKQLLKYFDHFSFEFLEQRKKGLNKFLKRIACHPILTFNKIFMRFLTAKSPELTTLQGSVQGKGVLSSMSDMFADASVKLRLKNPDEEFAAHTEYLDKLVAQLSTFETTTGKLYGERKEFLMAAKNFSPAIKFWSNAEVVLSEPLTQLAATMETSNSSLQVLNESSTQSVVSSLKENQLYCESALAVLRYRNKLQFERDRLREEREKKVKAKEDPKLQDNPVKLERLEKEFEKVNIECETAIDKVECANAALRADLDRWMDVKSKELTGLVVDMADQHIEYHEKSLRVWNDLITAMKTPEAFTTVKKVSSGELELNDSMQSEP